MFLLQIQTDRGIKLQVPSIRQTTYLYTCTSFVYYMYMYITCSAKFFSMEEDIKSRMSGIQQLNTVWKSSFERTTSF